MYKTALSFNLAFASSMSHAQQAALHSVPPRLGLSIVCELGIGVTLAPKGRSREDEGIGRHLKVTKGY
jgi:hypothetical protein